MAPTSVKKQLPRRFISYHVEFFNEQGKLLDGISMTLHEDNVPERQAYAFRRLNNNAILEATRQVKFYEYGRISI